ncbi:ComGF family competence protein [Planococcus sp. MERTA32b]|nr:ComGF family competence protein [Planococcus sp. MER TA 32b]
MLVTKKGFPRLSSETGFIYFDALIDLVLVAAIMPLIILFYLYTAEFMEDLDPGEVEWRLFTADMQSYLTDVDAIEIINDGKGFRVVQGVNEYDIEVYGTFIRKQRLGQGHEIMVTGISSCTFSIVGKTLKVSAIRSNGKEERSDYAITGP